jgi:hypothetical protein
MACIVEHYDPSSLEHRKTLMDLFGCIAGERRLVRLHNSQAEYAEHKARVAKVLIGVREKDPELANWCAAELSQSDIGWQ